MAIFFLKSLYTFSLPKTEIFRFGSKFSKKYTFTFQNFFDSLIQWRDTQCTVEGFQNVKDLLSAQCTVKPGLRSRHTYILYRILYGSRHLFKWKVSFELCGLFQFCEVVVPGVENWFALLNNFTISEQVQKFWQLCRFDDIVLLWMSSVGVPL